MPMYYDPDTGETYERGEQSVPRAWKPRTIADFNSAGDSALKFGDFAKLKSGKDKYSAMTLDQLPVGIDAETIERLTVDLGGDIQSIKSALRWIARGLRADLALKKVSIDLEVARSSISARVDAERRRQKLDPEDHR